MFGRVGCEFDRSDLNMNHNSHNTTNITHYTLCQVDELVFYYEKHEGNIQQNCLS